MIYLPMKVAYFLNYGTGKTAIAISEVEKPQLGSNKVLLKLKVLGLNIADIPVRNGQYKIVAVLAALLGYTKVGLNEKYGALVKTPKVGENHTVPTFFYSYANVANALIGISYEIQYILLLGETFVFNPYGVKSFKKGYLSSG